MLPEAKRNKDKLEKASNLLLTAAISAITLRSAMMMFKPTQPAMTLSLCIQARLSVPDPVALNCSFPCAS